LVALVFFFFIYFAIVGCFSFFCIKKETKKKLNKRKKK